MCPRGNECTRQYTCIPLVHSAWLLMPVAGNLHHWAVCTGQSASPWRESVEGLRVPQRVWVHPALQLLVCKTVHSGHLQVVQGIPGGDRGNAIVFQDGLYLRLAALPEAVLLILRLVGMQVEQRRARGYLQGFAHRSLKPPPAATCMSLVRGKAV